MFQEFGSKMKEHILSTGEIIFEPAIKTGNSSSKLLLTAPKEGATRQVLNYVLNSYVKNLIFFQPADTTQGKEEIGSFYLALHGGYLYEMNRLDITADMGPALELFMLELILKTAIKEAQLAHVFELTVSCPEELIADAFLTYHFSIERSKSVVVGGYGIFHGKKLIHVEEQVTADCTGGSQGQKR